MESKYVYLLNGSKIQFQLRFTLNEKRKIFMVQVTKAEAEYILAHSKNIHITTTSKGKASRQKKRYADELRETFRLLKEFHRKQLKRGA